MELNTPTALQRTLEYYYSSGFWYGFVTGVATGMTVAVALARILRRN